MKTSTEANCTSQTLSAIERALVAALVSAILSELRAGELSEQTPAA